jgi:hypothetical protein
MATTTPPRQRLLQLGLYATVCISSSALAQQPAPSDTTALQAVADKAINFVLQREALDPTALVPQTGKALPQNGAWSIARVRPASCPQTQQTCVLVLYRVPNTEVSCEWVVLLAPDGINGTILEQNLDSIRYLLRTVPPAELKPLIVTRALPIPIRNGMGTVELRVFVSATGDPINTIVMSGPQNLQATSMVAAKQWLFKPLKAGNRPIPYQFTLKFSFSPSGRVTSDP